MTGIENPRPRPTENAVYLQGPYGTELASLGNRESVGSLNRVPSRVRHSRSFRESVFPDTFSKSNNSNLFLGIGSFLKKRTLIVTVPTFFYESVV